MLFNSGGRSAGTSGADVGVESCCALQTVSSTARPPAIACHIVPQGIEEHFLEQWHQKLHTNTTPEDVAICEAYLVR